MGFRVVERLAVVHRIPVREPIARSLTGKGTIRGEAVVLSKPETYMNRSGDAVAALLRWTGADPSDLVVILDDLDLDPGVLRIRKQGSAGGHRGMISIIEAVGTDCFPRIRVGIGRPPQGGDVVAYVLSPFSQEEIPLIDRTIDRAAEAVESILSGDLTRAMNLYNKG